MLRLLLLILIIIPLTFGCGGNIPDSSDYTSSQISDQSEISEEESRTPPEEIYEFLNSEYTVTSKRESFGIRFVYEYYFIEGTVAGTKLMTTLPDEKTAEEYYEFTVEDYPDAVIDGFTVTLYIDDDEAYYYGYTLEKLKFVLEKSSYEYTVNFDEEEFLVQFPPEE